MFMKINWAVVIVFLLFHQNAMAFPYLCKVVESNSISSSILWGFDISEDHKRIIYTRFIDTSVPKDDRLYVKLKVLYSDENIAITMNEIDANPYDDSVIFFRTSRFDFRTNMMMSRFSHDVNAKDYALFKCSQ